MKAPWPCFYLTVTQVPSRFIVLLLVLDKAHVDGIFARDVLALCEPVQLSCFILLCGKTYR